MRQLRILTLLIVLALIPASGHLLIAQPLPGYELSVRNPVLDGTTYQFDVFIRQAGPTAFRLGNSQFILTFDAGEFTSPAISRVASSEQIGTGFFFDELLFTNEIRISLGGNGSYAAATGIAPTGYGTRVSTYRISGVTAPLPSPSLSWVNLPALVRTGVSEIDASDNYRDITDISGASHSDGGAEFARISGYKFEDLDGDGIWDQPAELPLDGWTIYSNGPNGPDTAVTGTGSWPTGYYEFINQTPGIYWLTEELQSGWSPTISPASPMAALSGQHSQDNNFGNFHGPTLRGTKFVDFDGDGVRDPGDTPLPGWQINADRTGGGGSKTQTTNALGEYVFTFLPSEAGEWTISETVSPGWIQSLPPGGANYTVNVASGIFLTGLDFGNYRETIISGKKFNDLNGDSLLTPGEPGLEGWYMVLLRDDLHFDSVLTDVNGDFLFDSLASGTYRLYEEPVPGWTQLSPAGSGEYVFVNDTGGYSVTDQDFANFRYGILSGEVYYDINHNGQRDSGESAMTGIEILLNGPKTSRSVFSGIGGLWSLDDVLADNLTITENIPAGYHLTDPVSGAYGISVTSGTVAGTLHFGNSASSDTNMFRTVSYDSLIESRDRRGKLLKPEKRKPDKVEFSMSFQNTTGEDVNGIRLRMLVPIYFGDSTYPFVVEPAPSSVDFVTRPRYVYIYWDEDIPPDSTIVIYGWGKKPKRFTRTYHLWLKNGAVASKKFSVISHSDWSVYRLPLPNRMNIAEDAMRLGGFPEGILVGLDRSDNPKFFSWARIRRLNHLKKSLLDRFVRHTIPSRAFYEWNKGKRMKKEQKRISPRKHDNRLFADALALKISIVASQMGILPAGLGELILQDGANPMNGKTLLEILSRADSLLTNYVARTIDDYRNMDTTLMKINESFEGPIDTVSFALDLQLKGTRKLQDVPFLRANPLAIPYRITPARPVPAEVPATFTLYQNYPNPFNPTTTIEFELPEPSVVTLTVFNVLGEEIGTLIDHELIDEGLQDIDFDADGLPSGVYFYRLITTTLGDEPGRPAGTSHRTKKMVLMK